MHDWGMQANPGPGWVLLFKLAVSKQMGGFSMAHQAGSEQQEACCDQQVEPKASKQSLVLHNVDDPLHCQLLSPEDKLQCGSTCCSC